MTTAREGILDNLATTLAGITTGAGYLTTVATVERAYREYDSTFGQRPWVAFWPQNESASHLPFGQIDCKMPVCIVAYVDVTDTGNQTTFQASATEALSNLRKDIVRALMVDPRRDANAIMTTFVSSESDEGVADATTHQGGVASMKMMFEVLYEESTGG